MNYSEKLVKSFLTGKDEEKVDNIKRENPTLSNQDVAKLENKKELDTFDYLENKKPTGYGRINTNE